MTDDINNGFPEEAGAVFPAAPEQGEGIRDTDIVFDCPHCGHGLVIDNRGAGLVIACAGCGKPVQVPIPEGMDISDLDQGPENLQLQIRTLRNALLKAENRERELQKLVSGLTERRSALERARAAQLRHLDEVRAACGRVQQLLSETATTFSHLADILQEDPPQ